MESSSCDKMGYENTRVPIITVTWSRQLCAIVAVGVNAFDGCIATWLLLPALPQRSDMPLRFCVAFALTAMVPYNRRLDVTAIIRTCVPRNSISS